MNLKQFPILFLLPGILFSGCYATKPVQTSSPVVARKKIALVHQEQKIYEVSDISFKENDLEGIYKELIASPPPKIRKTSMLDVYVDPEYKIEIDTSQAGPLSIPYQSIEKIEKTRFRFEYLLVVPVFIVVMTNLNLTGSSF